jgi:hypothetical protein
MVAAALRCAADLTGAEHAAAVGVDNLHTTPAATHLGLLQGCAKYLSAVNAVSCKQQQRICLWHSLQVACIVP